MECYCQYNIDILTRDTYIFIFTFHNNKQFVKIVKYSFSLDIHVSCLAPEHFANLSPKPQSLIYHKNNI